MNRLLIRFSDFLFSLLGLLVLLPFGMVVAVLIKVDSSGPVLFRQKRVGLEGRDFSLLKFRTMVVDADKKGLITVGNRDPRITRVGAFLRRFKMDELPQLLNVLAGEMSLVGPRPEVRKYVTLYSPEQRKVLSVKPGITDLASVAFANENELLSKAVNPDQYYINEIMPAKIRLNMVFIEHPTYYNYLRIIIRTFFRIFS